MIRSRTSNVKPDIIEEIGYLRGFGVLAVIAIHTTGYFTEVKQFNSLVLVNLWADIFSQFAVPLFILISGVVLAKNYCESFSLKEFYRKRVRSIIPQYFLFSILYTAFNHWDIMKNSSLDTNFALLLNNIWLADASYHLWFFSIIIQFYILYPLIIRIYSLFKQRNRSELLLVLMLMIQTFFMAGLHTSYLSGTKINFMGFLFYFCLGIYTWDHFDSFKGKFTVPKSFLLIMSIALTLGTSFFVIIGLTTGYRYDSIPAYFFIGPELIYPVLRVISFLFLFKVSMSFLGKRRSIFAKVIKRIGDYSFGIYLIHIFFNQSAIKILRNYQIDFDSWAFYPIVFAITIILSYLSIRLVSFLPFSYYLVGSQSRKRS